MSKLTNLTKRITAMLLSGMLVMGSVPGSVLAASSDADLEQTSESAEEVLNEDTSEVQATAGEMSEKSYSEEASAEEAAQYYTVTLDANGGYFENEWDDGIGDYALQAEVINKQIPVGGTVATFPVFTNQDGQTMIFAGWSLEPNGDLISVGNEEYAPVDNHTLYAMWETDESVNAADIELPAEDVSREDSFDTERLYTEYLDDSNDQTDVSQEFEDTETAEKLGENQVNDDTKAAEESETDLLQKSGETETEGVSENINQEEDYIEDDKTFDSYTVPNAVEDEDEITDLQNVVPDQKADLEKNEQDIDKNLTDGTVSKEETSPSVIEPSGEEEIVAEDAAMGVVASGICGDNLTWTLDNSGTFTVSGTGPMYHYNPFSGWNTRYVSDRAQQNAPDFFKDESYKKVKRIIINEGVTSIGDGAFGYFGLSGEIAPNSYGSFESISLPSTLNEIGCTAFYKTGCEEIIIDNGNAITIDSNAFELSAFRKMTLSRVEKLPRMPFSVREVVLKNGVKTISQQSFDGCKYLSTISLPNGITSIDKRAFNECTSLKNINLPGTLNSIGESAFYGSGLESVVIPANVNDIQQDVFRECKSLRLVTFRNTPSIIGRGWFQECDSLTSITIPEGVTSIGVASFYNCDNLSSVNLPTSLTHIYTGAFGDCNSLKQITLPANVSEVSTGAGGKMNTYSPFKGSRNLTTINVANGNNTYKSYDGCLYNSNLSELIYCPEGKNSITIAPSTTSINQFAFVTAKYLGHSEEEPKLKSIYFNTCSPNIPETTFPCITATAYYNNCLNNWPSDKRQNYGGTITWVEKALNLSDCTITISPTSYTYDGTAKNPAVTIKNNGRNLTNNTDYTLSYSNNTNAGTASVTITGKGNYAGIKTVDFTIDKASQSFTAANLSLSFPKTGKITATGNKGSLLYKSSNTAIATVDSTGKVISKGVGTATITVTAASTSNYKAATKKITVTVKKGAQSITVKAGASRIAAGKTTTVSITGAKGTKTFKSSNTTIATVNAKSGVVTAKKVGKVTITATSSATANFNAASKTVTINVVPAATTSLTATNQATGIKITWKKVAGATGYKVYRGATLLKTITSGSTVTYSDTRANTNGTKYTYKIVAKAATGDSTMSKSLVTYRITQPKIKALKNDGLKKVDAAWGKNSKASGYQLEYSSQKSFKTKKTVTVGKANSISRVITGLSTNNLYFFRIRSYKKVDAKTYYSSWSPIKANKTTASDNDCNKAIKAYVSLLQRKTVNVLPYGEEWIDIGRDREIVYKGTQSAKVMFEIACIDNDIIPELILSENGIGYGVWTYVNGKVTLISWEDSYFSPKGFYNKKGILVENSHPDDGDRIDTYYTRISNGGSTVVLQTTMWNKQRVTYYSGAGYDATEISALSFKNQLKKYTGTTNITKISFKKNTSKNRDTFILSFAK